MSKEVRAVGLAGFSPEAVVLWAGHDQDHLHLHPSLLSPSDGLTLEPDDGRRHVVLLRTLDKLHHLASVADDIHLTIIFADALELQKLGVPVLDMELDEAGKWVPCPRQTVDRMLQRMEDEAVSITIAVPAVRVKAASPKESSYSGPTFRAQLRTLKEKLNPKDKQFSFVSDVGVPAVLRLMNDLSKDEFKHACKNMLDVGGLPVDLVKQFFRWIEGLEGAGPTLGKAVDAFLFDDDENNLTTEEIAGKYGVDVNDLEFVANTYRQLTETND